MQYAILSFYRRLTIKLNLFFLVLSFLISLAFLSLLKAWGVATLLFVVNFVISNKVYRLDRNRNTGILCRLCGHKNAVLLFPARQKEDSQSIGSFACSSFDHGHYPDIYHCPECKNAFLKDIGTNKYQSFFDQSEKLYKDVIDDDYIKNIEARYLTNRKNVEKYLPYFKDKKVLEIGSYYGAFYHEVSKVCASYKGIEPSAHACDYLRPRLRSQDDLYQGTFEGYLKDLDSSEKYDTVVLYDVLEHVPDPIGLLKNINSLLGEGGVVLFSTINIHSVFSVVLGPYWPWFMDMHYYYFSDRGYVDMLHRSGFTMKNHRHYPYYVNLSYFLLKILSILFGTKKLPRWIEKPCHFPVRVCFGDTVLIEGQKVVLRS